MKNHWSWEFPLNDIDRCRKCITPLSLGLNISPLVREASGYDWSIAHCLFNYNKINLEDEICKVYFNWILKNYFNPSQWLKYRTAYSITIKLILWTKFVKFISTEFLKTISPLVSDWVSHCLFNYNKINQEGRICKVYFNWIVKNYYTYMVEYRTVHSITIKINHEDGICKVYFNWILKNYFIPSQWLKYCTAYSFKSHVIIKIIIVSSWQFQDL